MLKKKKSTHPEKKHKEHSSPSKTSKPQKKAQKSTHYDPCYIYVLPEGPDQQQSIYDPGGDVLNTSGIVALDGRHGE